MSVEGSNVVVAWAGAKSGNEGRNEWNASDIYYVFSKDGGNSWTKPIQVTDGFKSGMTSGRPQVAVRNGTIHLFYIQGKISYKQVSAGMVKLNQPPWPILYQQRPFPN
jgi:Neuraminidase (sialidase)